jgi:hypothetical protein
LILKNKSPLCVLYGPKTGSKFGANLQDIRPIYFKKQIARSLAHFFVFWPILTIHKTEQNTNDFCVYWPLDLAKTPKQILCYRNFALISVI